MAANRSQSWMVWSTWWFLLAEFVAVAFLVPPRLVRWVEFEERMMTHQQLGEPTALWVEWTGHLWYRDLFEDSGARNEVTLYFLPTAEERRNARGMDELGQDWWFPYWAARIEVWFNVLERLCHRVAMFIAWAPFFILMICLWAWRGVMSWRIRRHGFSYASPLKHKVGLFLMVSSVPFSLSLLLLPLPLPPLSAVPIAIVAGLGTYIMATYTRKRI